MLVCNNFLFHVRRITGISYIQTIVKMARKKMDQLLLYIAFQFDFALLRFVTQCQEQS